MEATQAHDPFSLILTERPRRNRATESIRKLIQETHVVPQHIVSPFFVIDGKNLREPIASMPGIERLTCDQLIKEIKIHYALGVRAIDLFAYISQDKKDPYGSEAYRQGNLIQTAIMTVKDAFPDLCVMADIALDPYTDHGHDGVIDANGNVINDASIKFLGDMALGVAASGVDIIAPSDMMDGRVGYLRKLLDENGFQGVGICSYTAKYLSALYQPFREALNSAPRIGDKKNYQLSPSSRREALREAALDAKEGADMLLVKPALPHLDIISDLRENSLLPIAAYHVSGEYAMVMAAHERGWLNAPKVFHEHLLCIRRAGADFILTYAAKQVFG